MNIKTIVPALVLLIFCTTILKAQTTENQVFKVLATKAKSEKSYSVKVSEGNWNVYTFVKGEFVIMGSATEDPEKDITNDIPLQIQTTSNGGLLTFTLVNYTDLLNRTALHIVYTNGEVMASEFLNKKSFTINTSDYPKGVYYYQVVVQKSKPFMGGSFEKK